MSNAKLTSREQQIADLIVSGMRDKNITKHLSIHPNNVRKHLSSIFLKLDVRNRTELAAYWVKQGKYTPCICGSEITLTKRQRQIAFLLTQGLTNQEIAQVLYLSKRTIEDNLYNCFQQLKLYSRTQLAVYYLTCCLPSLSSNRLAKDAVDIKKLELHQLGGAP